MYSDCLNLDAGPSLLQKISSWRRSSNPPWFGPDEIRLYRDIVDAYVQWYGTADVSASYNQPQNPARNLRAVATDMNNDHTDVPSNVVPPAVDDRVVVLGQEADNNRQVSLSEGNEAGYSNTDAIISTSPMLDIHFNMYTAGEIQVEETPNNSASFVRASYAPTMHSQPSSTQYFARDAVRISSPSIGAYNDTAATIIPELSTGATLDEIGTTPTVIEIQRFELSNQLETSHNTEHRAENISPDLHLEHDEGSITEDPQSAEAGPSQLPFPFVDGLASSAEIKKVVATNKKGKMTEHQTGKKANKRKAEVEQGLEVPENKKRKRKYSSK